MSKNKKAIILGALLHDVGKFMQRAELEKQYPEIKSYYEEFCPTPYSYLHAAHSAFFVERMLSDNLITKDIKSSLFDACRHHCDAKQEDIYKISDWLSAGMERYGDETAGGGYKETRLHSVFDSIELAFSIKGDTVPLTPLWYYPLSKLKMSKDIFPLHIQDWRDKSSQLSSGNLVPEYKLLWESFKKELEELNSISTQNFQVIFNELFYLLQKYTWCIPSATNTLPDISLFDHLKTTAAIAGCLYDCNQEGTIGGKDFLLFGADLSGIQSFIFQITSAQGVGGISKRLRGRSFYLMMIMEVLCRYILRKLGLTLANINFCGGGNIELLLPNTNKVVEFLQNFESEINQWLLGKFSGHLALIVDTLPMSKEDLRDHFGEMKAELHDRLSVKKKHKFKDLFSQKTFWLTQNIKNVSPICICKSCNLSMVENTDSICQDCLDQKKMGSSLSKTKTLVFSSERLTEKDYVNLPSYSFEPFGYLYLFDEPDFSLWSKTIGSVEMVSVDQNTEGLRGFYNLSNVLPVANRKMSLETEKDPDEESPEEREGRLREGQTMSFTTLADMAEGDSKIGILKMDVDNLGLIFSLGLEPTDSTNNPVVKFHSISRVSTLSREFSYFLNGIVSLACEEITKKWKKESNWGKKVGYQNDDVTNVFYVVFSGGDDLFIIGPWDRIIELAILIRDMFKDFTCHNPNLTISAGIFICMPKYPISLAATKTDEALKSSKTKGRNRITLFGETTVWDYEDRQKSRIFNEPINQKYAAFEREELCKEAIYNPNSLQAIEERVVPLSRLIEFHNKLMEFSNSKQIPRRFVHRLLEGKKKFFPVEYNFHKDRVEENQNKMILPYLFYTIHRNLNEQVSRIMQQDLITKGDAGSLLRQIKIPASMFLMKTRNNK